MGHFCRQNNRLAEFLLMQRERLPETFLSLVKVGLSFLNELGSSHRYHQISSDFFGALSHLKCQLQLPERTLPFPIVDDLHLQCGMRFRCDVAFGNEVSFFVCTLHGW